MNSHIAKAYPRSALMADITAGVVVFLVALPLCLGLSLASNAPITAGLLTGIIGGIVVGAISGSSTSVSGPSAALTAIIIAQIAELGSFEALLMATIIAGLIQVIFGCLSMGFIAAFFPTNVIKGLLSAIGLLLILKQLPHLFGWDPDFEGEMAFLQADNENTFSELAKMLFNMHSGALIIGAISLLILIGWNRSSLKASKFPSQLVVVIVGLIASYLFAKSPYLFVGPEHRVQLPVFDGFYALKDLFIFPDFSLLKNPKVYLSALSIALVASLETLLNLEAVDKIDPMRRVSPPNRELIAQGIGNILLGLIGGLPVTSVIVRSSVNISARAHSKNSTIIHGCLLLISVLSLSYVLNWIPLSCLAAILIVTGSKLIKINDVKEMAAYGTNQLLPYVVTVVAILFTDVLVGVSIGLCTSFFFILRDNFKSHLRVINEKHLNEEVTRLVFGNQVTFLNKASITIFLDELDPDSHVILDASHTSYIDADVLNIIRDFKEESAPVRRISLSLVGFKPRYDIDNQVLFSEHSSQELQQKLTPENILQIIKEGNERVRKGMRLKRDIPRQIEKTREAQYPLAAIVTCMDSRSPAELVFDLGIGDIFSVRIAGNVINEKVLGSLEFACAVAGAKLIIVMGHSRCGAISATLDLCSSENNLQDVNECSYLASVLHDLKREVEKSVTGKIPKKGELGREKLEERIIKENVLLGMENIKKSSVLRKLMEKGQIAVVGCSYDVKSGRVLFFDTIEEEKVEEPLLSQVEAI